MTRALKAYQRARHQEELTDTVHQVAVLEGRLMVAHDLDLEQFESRFFGGEYHTPWEKLDILLQAAAKAGV
jgi:hypothetical protein